MATSKIKKGDPVIVITGKDKGKQGKVVSVDTKNGKVVVEGVNQVLKHTKPSQANPNGGIIHQEAAIDISNVMYCYKGKPTRIGFQIDPEKGRKSKVRIAKATGDQID